MFNDNVILFLTACINPGKMPNTILTDKNERQFQYENALKWYLQNTLFRILFVENSGTDISDKFLSYINENRLEILTFNGNHTFDPKLGKGFGERNIIEYAIGHSFFLSKKPRVIKISGRIIIHNINELVMNSSTVNNIYVNTLIVDKRIFASSKLFICPFNFLQDFFLHDSLSIDESRKIYFEHCLYVSCKRWVENKCGKQKEFYLPILLEGVSGTSGKTLKNPSMPYINAMIKYLLRSIGIRKVKFYK